MSRKIVINDCSECPHKDHKGGCGNPAYEPCCRKKKGRKLPYTCSGSSRRSRAIPTNVIPKWCPLEKEPAS